MRRSLKLWKELRLRARQVAAATREAAHLAKSSRSRAALLEVVRGKRVAAKRDVKAARRAYERAIELDPNYFRAHSFLAHLLLRFSELDAAEQHFRRAVELAPKDVGSALGHAAVLRAIGNLPSAERALRRLIEVRSDRAEPFFRLADVLLELGRFEEASALVIRGSESADVGLGSIKRAEGYEWQGRNAEAMELYLSRFAVPRERRAAWPGLIRTIPLVQGPERALGFWRKLLEPAPAPRPPHRAKAALERLLIVSRNWNFLQELVGVLEQRGVEIRTLEPGAYTDFDFEPPVSLAALRTEQPLDAELFDWADTVFCDWCNDVAVWLSNTLPTEKRLVVRLHSGELLSPWPVLVNWSRVDRLIAVTEHGADWIREALELETEIAVIPPSHQTARFHRPKREGAEYTLGMIGWGTANKDPLVALEILARLRERDPRWHLELLGANFSSNAFADLERRYRVDFERRLRTFPAGAVERSPWTDDVAGWLEQIGFILSTSLREGTHEAIAEGMSSGAIPVVRRWPVVKRWRGAESRYPNAILFDEANEAAAAIAALAPEERRAASEAARAEAERRFDHSIAAAQLAEALS